MKKAQALKTGEALRKRIASHPTIMVLNDEAHHLHDLDSTWNEAITNLDTQSKQRGNSGICAQMDFTATPKHNDGALFKHIVCDFPLGEAVDAGIVKVPVIFRSDELKPRSFDNAAQKWEVFLKAGYERYEFAYAEWNKSRKPILFVMTESAPAANEIAAALDSDDYPLLKGRVVNLHTRLKGKIKTIKQGGKTIKVFEENEKDISDDDLKALREISRNLDAPDSKYRCVVSVMMLREGWDVLNVTTIVPLRPYAADSNILAEQTLGRGLRRMTPPGQTLERVTVVEHSAFVRLYEQELSNEGVIIGTEGNEAPTPISTTIFVDPKKPTQELEIEIPRISSSIQVTPTLENLTFEEVQTRFSRKGYSPLPINSKKSGELVFERALFTEELVASFKLDRGLLAFGIGAVSVFVKELERACGLQSAHATLAPLIQRFLEEVLFEQQVSLYNGSIDHRLADIDVAEHVRAVFAPLTRERTITQTERKSESSIARLSEWKPYQASSTPTRPCIPAERTLFNLVPCTMGLEAEFVDFCDTASANDVAAFAKNAGPQKLMIDFQASNGRPAHYVPDFFVRLNSGHYCLVELKGQEDRDVPLKARAAVEWCAAASTKQRKWEYVFVSQQVFESNNEFSMQALARACRPRLANLLEGLKTGQLDLPLEETPEELKQERTDKALTEAGVFDLPENIREYVGYAVAQLAYARRKNYSEFGSAFAPLLVPFEQLCGDIIRKCLGPLVPKDHSSRRYYFDPDLSGLELKYNNIVKKNQVYLQKLLVSGINTNRIGTLLFCLEYALEWETDLDYVWSDVVKVFSESGFEALLPVLREMYFFRNKHVAHADELLIDGAVADAAMKQWVIGLSQLSKIATT